MKILGIETSCDETAISLIEIDEKKHSVSILGNTVHSQIDLHSPHGGVFPMLAKREHQANLIPVLKKTLKEAGMLKKATGKLDSKTLTFLEKEESLSKAFAEFIPSIARPDMDFISITTGPGLEPALWVGISFARALSHAWNIPLIPCNHMEGHILSALIQKKGDAYELLKPQFPALSLLISGGHTQIVLVEKVGVYKILGETRDDAIGECFDKVARMLGLTYPGGPKISKLAKEARAHNIHSPEPLPRPMIDSKNFDFSFSGLKTAVLYLVQKLTTEGTKLTEHRILGIARETEDAVTDVLISKMRKAIEHYAIETIIVGGGVIANEHIRMNLEKLATECSIKLLLPQTDHSTDNGLMIALAGFYNSDKKTDSSTHLKAQGTLSLGPRA